MEVTGVPPQAYDDLDVFFFFSRHAAQYFRMRADIARRLAGVNRCFPSRRSGEDLIGFAGRMAFVCLDDASKCTGVDGFVAGGRPAERFGTVARAISMPNISERSSLASTFAAAGPLRLFERSDPAFTIKSC